MKSCIKVIQKFKCEFTIGPIVMGEKVIAPKKTIHQSYKPGQILEFNSKTEAESFAMHWGFRNVQVLK